jgi:hypothetical protein
VLGHRLSLLTATVGWENRGGRVEVQRQAVQSAVQQQQQQQQ